MPTAALHNREASKKASLLLDSTILDDTRTPLKLPHFETAVMIAATKALELWRNEALEGDRHAVLYLMQSSCLHMCSVGAIPHIANVRNAASMLYFDLYIFSKVPPAIATAVLQQICAAVARTIVAMEQGYVTAAFFRHRMFERYRQWEEQDRLGRMLDDGQYPSRQISHHILVCKGRLQAVPLSRYISDLLPIFKDHISKGNTSQQFFRPL